jgi:cation-transporting ATPase E
VAGVATMSGYLVGRRHDELTLDQQRTVSVIVLFMVALWVLAILARPMNAWRLALVLSMGGAFVGVLLIPPLRRYFDLPIPTDSMTLAAIGIGLLAAGLLELGWRLAGWSRTLGDRPTPNVR